MKISSPFSLSITINLIVITLISFSLQTVVYCLGSASTITITYGTDTVCGIIAAEPTQRIQCYQNSQIISVQPNISFEAISGGCGFFCGLRSDGFSILCWDTTTSSNSTFKPKRIYYNETIKMTDLAVGDAQVCAREVNSGIAKCWRGSNEPGSKSTPPGDALRFRAITSGSGFSCGILKNNRTVLCWGNGSIGAEIQRQFGNLSMSTLVAGESHACGLTLTGILVCKGNNGSGQLDVPFSSAYEFSGLALGANFTCAIKARNGLVACWGGKNRFEFDSSVIDNVSFESIVAGLDFVCGLTSKNLYMICWGPGWSNMPKIAFDAELALLSRLHHKHLVGLIGFCEEKDERLLVYEYMSNGSLHDHLHNKNDIDRSGSIWNSWKMRIKIALDAARGIEYLHNYAVPPIIHRDIKSSNILLDANWTARVSDFGLSLMGPESEHESMSIKAVGTIGYIDPEYYVLNVLTTKSDVYGLGVVLLELLTGKRAVFKNEEDGTGPMGVVEYAGPLILAGQLKKVLDKTVGPLEMNEAEAVRLVAYTAMHCVHLEGKERPNMSDIVANLERALALCEDNPGSLSPATIHLE
ncbi:putative serine/threonine-protein kinase-like protein ccr3 [Quercus suber]|uniref:non-specific serine/threonine protein kinase n=1 Tax=Quercus suber TaxID=58331 RepID=A0AAW0KN23_QUESU